ncbi:DeoR/GlpR family DNA-binding transcription regulator [Gryllotalpicola ginsengisoli]|uniref:DeoR/GlpR family DNA-binding transcription regulator n=1 Tax=Gryllotalpicola ginsengisoli TaxID=444608 RepID=UPI0003B49FC6|nr:DeoR/GlpR family DNA-binding transcription regulator [Gryllotalpicola ginsengisoli]
MTIEEQLSASERRSRTLASVVRRGFVRVADLAEEFGVSTVTVRADLDVLEADGAIRRVRGGAMPAGAADLTEQSLEHEADERADEKARIAVRAVDELESGMSVLLDVGSTTAAVARELARRESLTDLTVITNGLAIALALEPAVPRLQVVVTGGTLRPLQHSLVAPLADTLLPRVRADVAVIGCNGVDVEAGLTNINLPETEVKRAMIAAATRTVVVADGSKLGRVHLGAVAAVADVDVIITGRGAPRRCLADLRAVGGPQVVVAQ